VTYALLGAAVVVLIVVVAVLVTRGKKAAGGAKPHEIDPGDQIAIRRKNDPEPITYDVAACGRFEEPGEDEHWLEFELTRAGDNTVYFLEYERDQEARWVWVMSRKLRASELDGELMHSGVGPGKKEKPPEEIAHRGRLWQVIKGSHHYKVDVADRRVDRPELHRYRARFTDYRAVGGDDELSLEVWEGGMGLTVKEARVDDVSLIKR
jgi:hypothetical protein